MATNKVVKKAIKKAVKKVNKKKFKTPGEMQKAIDTYFEDNKKQTVTGLALHLGFTTASNFSRYTTYGSKFKDVVNTSRLRIQNYYEKKLIEGKVAGVIFALKNLGWTDRPDLKGIQEHGLKIEIVKFSEKRKKK